MQLLEKFITNHPLKKHPLNWLVGFSILVELILLCWGFRILDKVVYLSLQRIGVLPSPPEVTIKLIFLLSTISTIILFSVLYIIQKIRKSNLEEFGLSRNFFPSVRNILFIVFAAAVLQAIIGLIIGPWLERLLNAPKNAFELNSFTSYLLSCSVAFIGGGFREELFFRGYLISRIRFLLSPLKIYGLIIALVAQIVLFSISHWYQGPVGVIETSLLATACTFVYLSTGSLWAAIIFHGAFDVFGFTSIYLGL